MKVCEFQDMITEIATSNGRSIEFDPFSKNVLRVNIANYKARHGYSFMVNTSSIKNPAVTAADIWASYKVSEEAPNYARNRFASTSTPTTKIKKVIFNDPATIVFWEDGTKTVVKCSQNDIFDPEKGLAMAIAKRTLGDQGNYYNEFKKWIPAESPKPAIVVVGRAADRASDALKVLIDDINTFKNSAKELEDFWYDR